jgi:hypothetical protein
MHQRPRKPRMVLRGCRPVALVVHYGDASTSAVVLKCNLAT